MDDSEISKLSVIVVGFLFIYIVSHLLMGQLGQIFWRKVRPLNTLKKEIRKLDRRIHREQNDARRQILVGHREKLILKATTIDPNFPQGL